MSSCENILNNLSEDQKNSIKEQIEDLLNGSPFERSGDKILNKIKDLQDNQAQKYLSSARALADRQIQIKTNFDEMLSMNKQSIRSGALKLTPRDLLLSAFEQGNNNHFSNSKRNLNSLVDSKISSSINSIAKDIRISKDKELQDGWKLLTDIAFKKETIAKQEKLGVDVLKEFGELNAKNDPRFGFTENKEAGKIAKIIHEKYTGLMKENELVGIKINTLDRYIGKQTHDKQKIFGESTAWKDFIDKNLDFEKTFGKSVEGDERQTLINQLKDSIIDGNDDLITIQTKNIGTAGELFDRRFNKHREIFFKDFEAGVEYNRQFSNGNIFQNLIKTIESLSRANVITKEWGLMPDLAIAESINYTNKLSKEHFAPNEKIEFFKTPGGITANGNYSKPIETAINNAFGVYPLGKNLQTAQTMANIRKVGNLGMLGEVFTSTLADPANLVARNITARNSNALTESFEVFGYLANHIKDMVAMDKTKGFQEVRAFADSYGISLENTKAQIQRMMLDGIDNDAKGGITGVINKLTDNFYKLNLLNRDSEVKALNLTTYLGRDLFRASEKSFKDLNIKELQTFKEYGFNEKDFQLLSDARKIAIDKGLEVIPSDLIYEVKAIDFQTAKNLEEKITNYFREEANTIFNFSSQKTRRVLTAGTEAGTIEGELARNFSNLKSWPTMQWENMYKSILTNPALGKMDKTKGLGALIVFSYVLTQAGLMMKDVAQGKSPRDPFASQSIIDTIDRSGIFGIVGDLALAFIPSSRNLDFGKYRPTRAAANLAFGPIGGKIDTLTGIVESKKREGLTINRDKAVRFIKGLIPYNNLLGVNGVFTNVLYEMGLLDKKKAEKVMKKHFNQRFMLD